MKKKAFIDKPQSILKVCYNYLLGYGIYGIAALFWILVLSVGTYKRYNNYRLFYHGKIIKAWVTNKEYEGLSGTKGYYYTFNLGNQTVTGHTIYQHNFSVGDTIKVYYLESNPEINQDSVHVSSFFK